MAQRNWAGVQGVSALAEGETVKLKFSEIYDKVPSKPGIYEIYTNEGVALKVGIASNLKSRLTQHANSKQGALKFTGSKINATPSEVQSKQSILAKHLYFDTSIAPKYDLTTEEGRKDFLNECCFLLVSETKTRELAREIEKQKESSGAYRYVGRVIKR